MKKHLIILVLKMLENESDKYHPLTQSKIADTISDVYPCDRKTVGRNIVSLVKIGYPIVKTTKGYYLDKKDFSIEERDFVIKAIYDSPHKTMQDKEDLVIRLKQVLKRIQR